MISFVGCEIEGKIVDGCRKYGYPSLKYTSQELWKIIVFVSECVLAHFGGETSILGNLQIDLNMAQWIQNGDYSKFYGFKKPQIPHTW